MEYRSHVFDIAVYRGHPNCLIPYTGPGKGYIVAEELRELCSGLGISAEDSDVIYNDLDQDKDGKISYSEFTKGFIEFFSPEAEAQTTKRFSTW